MFLALASMLFATVPTVAGIFPLWLTVLLHEGSTLLVALNSLRLLTDPQQGTMQGGWLGGGELMGGGGMWGLVCVWAGEGQGGWTVCEGGPGSWTELSNLRAITNLRAMPAGSA